MNENENINLKKPVLTGQASNKKAPVKKNDGKNPTTDPVKYILYVRHLPVAEVAAGRWPSSRRRRLCRPPAATRCRSLCRWNAMSASKRSTDEKAVVAVVR